MKKLYFSVLVLSSWLVVPFFLYVFSLTYKKEEKDRYMLVSNQLQPTLSQILTVHLIFM